MSCLHAWLSVYMTGFLSITRVGSEYACLCWRRPYFDGLGIDIDLRSHLMFVGVEEFEERDSWRE